MVKCRHAQKSSEPVEKLLEGADLVVAKVRVVQPPALTKINIVWWTPLPQLREHCPGQLKPYKHGEKGWGEKNRLGY